MPTADAVSGVIRVENVGGIESAEVPLEPGVNILAGRNATNRTSLLRAVMAAFGSDQASLKADADAGEVAVSFGDQTYSRTFERRNDAVVTDGAPYLEDTDAVELADLFAFLLESNEARRAVARGADLRELIVRPIDTESIRTEIEQTMRERDRIDDQLAELDDLADSVPSLETRRQQLRSEIEDVEDELAETRAELEAAESTVDETSDDPELEEVRESLESVRSEYSHIRQRLETERASIESLEAERDDLEAELAELPEAIPAADVDAKIEQLREEQAQIDTLVTELQSILEFNQDFLDGSSRTVQTIVEQSDISTTGDLLPESEQQTVCWTCGSVVDRSAIDGLMDQLRELRQEALADRSEIRAEIEELTTRKRERREVQADRERLEQRIADAESELAERRSRLEELQASREELTERIDGLEAEVAALQAEGKAELVELSRTVNELEFERDSLEADLERVESELAAIEAQLDERESLETERDELSERLRDLRERIERIERDASEQFNEHMDRILEVLDYENIERIWIDRLTDSDPTRFDLRIVRSRADETVYEDSVDHLSESEREVIGLVFALAGYLVHDAHETVPLMILDSIEAIDSERIADLIAYFADFSEMIVVALLPADAAAVDDGYHFVTDI